MQQEHPDTLRLPCNPPWARREQRSLQIDYSFVAPVEQGSRITLAAANFHLGSRGWVPLPQPPDRVLAPYPERPPKTYYTVRVPDNFLILAAGAPAGRKKAGGETEYRFELRKDDLPAYIVAGRYVRFLRARRIGGPIRCFLLDVAAASREPYSCGTADRRRVVRAAKRFRPAR